MHTRTVIRPMFRKQHLDPLYDELKRDWQGKTEYEQLLRDTHLGVAQVDAGRPLGDEIHPAVVALIEKHSPKD